MRVLFASTASVVYENRKLLHALVQKGIDVSLICPTKWRDRHFGLIPLQLSENENFPVFSPKILFNGHLTGFIFDPITIVKALLKTKPDIIHLNLEPASLSALELVILSSFSDTRIVTFSWETMFRNIRFVNDLAIKKVLSSTDHLIGGNSKVIKVMEKWGYKGPSSVLPQHGLDTSSHVKLEAKEFYRNKFEIRQNAPVIGFVGRFIEEKGIRVLLRALKMLNMNITALFIGSGPLNDEIRQSGSEKVIIKIFGPIQHDKVPEFIRSMDLLALPSMTSPTWEEQFGHVLIEAMSLGVPVIGSKSGAIPEVIADSGLLFEEGNEIELSARIKSLLQDQTLSSMLSERGPKRVKENYTWDVLAEKTLKIYAGLYDS